MYRQQKRSLATTPILVLMLIGLVVGTAYFVYDNLLNTTNTPVPTQVAPIAPQAIDPGAVPMNETTTTISDRVDISTGELSDSALFIPTAGIYAPIIETFLDGESWDVSQLGMNVGHLQGTADVAPGLGNIVLSGHVEMSDGRAGIFATLHELNVGDLVVLTHEGDERRYQVMEVSTVEPTDLTSLYPTTSDQLTLITCGNYNFFSDSYQERIVVVAERIV